MYVHLSRHAGAGWELKRRFGITAALVSSTSLDNLTFCRLLPGTWKGLLRTAPFLPQEDFISGDPKRTIHNQLAFELCVNKYEMGSHVLSDLDNWVKNK